MLFFFAAQISVFTSPSIKNRRKQNQNHLHFSQKISNVYSKLKINELFYFGELHLFNDFI